MRKMRNTKWKYSGLENQPLVVGMKVLLSKRFPNHRYRGRMAFVQEIFERTSKDGASISLMIDGKLVRCTEADLIGVKLYEERKYNE